MCATKWLVIVLNVIFVIVGLALLGGGLVTRYTDYGLIKFVSNLPDISDESTDASSMPVLIDAFIWLLIIAGSAISVFGFIGCIGAWKNWRFFLGLYVAGIAAIVLIEIIAIAVGCICLVQMEENLETFMEKSVEEQYQWGLAYKDGDLVLANETQTRFWDYTQISLECCGVISYKDYYNAQNWYSKYQTPDGDKINAKIPLSCCKMENTQDYPNALENVEFVDMESCLTDPDKTNSFQEGCYDIVASEIEWVAQVLLIIVAVFVSIQISLMCCASRMCKRAGQYKEVA